MADYIINFTDPANGSFVIKPMTTNGPLTPVAPTPLDPQATSANTSLVLLGKGMYQYGERVAEDFVHMLENFAYATSPAYPIQGQLWFKNTSPQSLNVLGTQNFTIVAVNAGLNTWTVSGNHASVFNITVAPGNALTVSGNTNTPSNTTYTVISATNNGANTDIVVSPGTIPVASTATGTIHYIAWQTVLTSSLPTTGDLDMGGFKIINLGNPTLPTDALNLGFADTRYVNIAGDTMTGTLTVSSADIVLTGGTAKITLPNAPLIATDAVNKSYVDALTLNSLSDVVITLPLVGQLLNYDGVNWINSTFVIPTTLNDLTDVTIAAPVLGNILTYNGAQWVNLPPAAFTDRYVVSGTMLGTTLVLTMSTPLPSPTVSITGISPTGHLHQTTDIFRDTYVPDTTQPDAPIEPVSVYEPSYLRQLFITTATGYPNPQYPAAISLEQAIQLIDQALYAQTALNKTVILQGDGVTTIFTDLPQYLAASNRLFITTNGVKQYASQRFNLLLEMDTFPVNVGSDTGLVDGAYSFDINVDGTSYPGITVTVIEDRTITAVVVGVNGTWTITGNHADELGPGTYVEVTGNSGTGDGVYLVLTSTNSGGNTDIVVDIGPGVPTFPEAAIPVGATPDGTLRKSYYYQQLLEDIDAAFSGAGVPATIFFRDSTFTIFSNTVGSISTVYISNDLLFSALQFNLIPNPASYFYDGSVVGIDAANAGTATFQVIGDYTAAFPTGVHFVVFGSTGNDGEYTTIAPATFAAGFTTIYVTTVTTTEASPTGTGDIFFARDLSYEESGPALFDAPAPDSVTFNVAPTAGDLIEVIVTP